MECLCEIIKNMLFYLKDSIIAVWGKTQNHHIEIANLFVQGIITAAAVGGHFFSRKLFHPTLRMTFEPQFPYFNKTICYPQDEGEIKYVLIHKGKKDLNVCTCQYNSQNAAKCNYQSIDQGHLEINDGIPTFSYKIKIRNKGWRDAKNVQVYLGKIRKVGNENCDVTNILPMNLMWSYQDNKNEMLSIVPVISPRMERFCDFIFVNPVQCYFRTEVTVPVGHTRNDTLTSGKYIANLFISTSNFKSVEYCIIFRYTKYNEDHGETIKEIKCYRIRWYHKLFEYIGMLFHNLLFK